MSKNPGNRWRRPLTISIAGIALAVALTACMQGGTKKGAATGQAAGTGAAHSTGLTDASVIPSYGGPKTQTTNEHGGTSSGMGTSVYSLIGSSGLHSNGFSSHLESRLSGAGVQGVKVFVIDDTVILAADSRQPTASSYDPLQQKVLSQYGGQSGRGPEPNQPVGTEGSGGATDDNLSVAAAKVKELMGGSVKVMTVENPQAMEAIDRLRTNMGNAAVPPQSVADDLQTLLELASQKK